jgi:DNA-binding response OmpR family regulator
MPSILIIACDPYLAGIYGRKFELDGWEVAITENLNEGEKVAPKIRPNIILLDDECSMSIAGEVRRLKNLPTLLKSKIVVLSQAGNREEIHEALAAGAADYLLIGHFVPQEAVQKMRRLLS